MCCGKYTTTSGICEVETPLGGAGSAVHDGTDETNERRVVK